MNPLRWKSPSPLAVSAALLALRVSMVSAAEASSCSSENTGSTSTNSIYMSNGQCSDHCQGYAFAIVQGQTCWCSNLAPSGTTGGSDCSHNCPGYPFEKCGGDGTYGYIQLGTPSGTAGASSASPSSTSPLSSLQQQTSVQVSTAPPQTVVQTQTNVVVNTQVQTQQPSSVPPSTFSPPPVSSTVESTSAPTVMSTSAPPSSAPPPPSSSAPPSEVPPKSTSTLVSTTTPTPSAVISAQVVTVSGAVVTNYITSTPSAVPVPAQSNELPHPTNPSLSKGAVAGITIATLVGVAILAGIMFIFCRRRRQKRTGDSEGGIRRNASVLSKVGLLSGDNQMQQPPQARLPPIRTTGISPEEGHLPESAATFASSQISEARRTSRPVFVDHRLNPNALMAHVNSSRSSVGTLQDNQDYSRPLEVRNPDG